MQINFTYFELCVLFAHVDYIVSDIQNNIDEISNSTEYKTWLDIKHKLSVAVGEATLQEITKK